MKAHNSPPFFKIFLLLAGLLVLFSPLYMYFSHDVGKLLSHYPHQDMQEGQVHLVFKEKKPASWIEEHQVSTYAKWAIIFSEDWAFYQHQGVDLEQIKVALTDMLSFERFRGASTISQQMVKNVFLTDERSLWRKIHEFILTQRVEKVLSKKKILTVYLNIIEFGPGIYGIKNASFHYFKKHPSELTAREGAFLAMLLPSPKRYYVSFKKGRLTPFARERVNKLRIGKVISRKKFLQELDETFFWEKP
jgi:monofunctional glycosyltransferase